MNSEAPSRLQVNQHPQHRLIERARLALGQFRNVLTREGVLIRAGSRVTVLRADSARRYRKTQGLPGFERELDAAPGAPGHDDVRPRRTEAVAESRYRIRAG